MAWLRSPKIGECWRAQVRQRGQSIPKTFRTKGATCEIEDSLDEGRGVVGERGITVGELVS
ncbi:hypothetical protein DIE06_12595 [Burkholderia sp. Bp8998]|nr:hypothetical protein DIE06_12595 [Burkholderia sp. Bp8998]